MTGKAIGPRQKTARGQLYRACALTVMSCALGIGDNRAAGDCDDTPLAQASPAAIRSCLKQTRPEARLATAAAYAVAETAREERTQALNAAMTAASPARVEKATYPGGVHVYTTAVAKLKEGARRGEITYPLYKGTVGSANGRAVYFVLSEASDREFAEAFGITHATRLGNVNEKGIEDGSTLSAGGTWVFPRDPGWVAHTEPNGQVTSGKENPDYSPLKSLLWKERNIIVNAPFVKWGEGPGQQLIIDHGGCDPLIRRSPPSRLRVGGTPDAGGGPEGCDRQGKNPLNRYRGGQALEIRLLNGACQSTKPWKPCGWVTMKLHQTVHREDVYPYLTVFSASEADIAEELGVPHTPKLAYAGRSNASPPLGLSGDPGGNEGVSAIVEFHNGVETWAGGPAGFQPGVISYGEPTWSTYSPIVHVTWAFFDCGGAGKHFPKDRNESFGVMPQTGIAGFDPTQAESFNPYLMTYLNVACPEVAARLAGGHQGTVYASRLSELWTSGDLVITESPAGWLVNAIQGDYPLPDHESKMHLVLNAPAPVAVIRR